MPKPKYKIGDVIVYNNNKQFIINKAELVVDRWMYSPKGHNFFFGEECISYKL